MQINRSEDVQFLDAKPRISGVRVGRIIELTMAGPRVDFDGNPYGPQLARSAGSVSGECLRAADAADQAVLLLFEANDPRQPIIIDTVAGAPPQVDSESNPVSSPEHPVQVSDVPAPSAPASGKTAQTMRLAAIAFVRDGCVFIEEEGNGKPVRAQTTVPIRNLRDRVLVALLDEGPVIFGQLYDNAVVAPDNDGVPSLVLKGARIHIEADEELLLKVGRAKIRLDAAGKAVTTGEQVVSRARGTNKVQGGSVKLN